VDLGLSEGRLYGRGGYRSRGLRGNDRRRSRDLRTPDHRVDRTRSRRRQTPPDPPHRGGTRRTPIGVPPCGRPVSVGARLRRVVRRRDRRDGDERGRHPVSGADVRVLLRTHRGFGGRPVPIRRDRHPEAAARRGRRGLAGVSAHRSGARHHGDGDASGAVSRRRDRHLGDDPSGRVRRLSAPRVGPVRVRQRYPPPGCRERRPGPQRRRRSARRRVGPARRLRRGRRRGAVLGRLRRPSRPRTPTARRRLRSSSA